MTNYAEFTFYLNIVTLLVTGVLVPFARVFYKNIMLIRENDLAHLNAALSRIEQKLDRHLEWHATAPAAAP